MKNKFIVIVCLLMLMSGLKAQDNEKIIGFSLHSGISVAFLDNTNGGSFSFNFGYRTHKVLQLEAELYSAFRSGSSFLAGDKLQVFELGLAAGIRVNFRPAKIWNPSIGLKPALIYTVKGVDNAPSPDINSVFAGLAGEFSNRYNQHMISIGAVVSAVPEWSMYLKYGYWF